MRKLTGVWVGASLLGLLGTISGQGCGLIEDENDGAEGSHVLGDLALGLTLPDGSEVTAVQYVILNGGAQVRQGQLQVGADGKASGTISGLAPGSDYLVRLTAPRDAGVSCSGEASFAIVANQTATANVVLQCDELSADGNLTVNGTFNLCPKVTSTSVSPVTVQVGASATVTASARDRDNDALGFVWSAASGSFASPGAATSLYTCAAPGVQTLQVAVNDGPARGCTRSATVTVTCVASALDGGAAVDSGAPSDGSVGDAGVGVGSSQSAYLVPSLPNVVIKPMLTVGDSANLKPDGTPYRMVGLPDGLGAYDNGNGTFTLLANHELGNTAGIARAHGGTGTFVSKWTIRTSDLKVLKGEDLIQQVRLWDKNTSSYVQTPNVSFGRFCSADLAAESAFYDAASATGFKGRMLLNGEETGVEGRALAHGLDGVTWELPRLGKQSWENYVASPSSGLKTVVIGMDDSSPSGQVLVYVGTKTNVGSNVDRAGLTNGTLYGVKVPGVLAETSASVIPEGPFELASLGNVENQTGAQLESASAAAGVTGFLRPEDGAWDPSSPNDFYFATTASVTTNSRIWRLRFSDVKQPELGGVITAVLDGSEGHRMIDNLTVDTRGHILAVEDVGGNERLGKVWRYTIATDSLVEIASHDPARFITGAPGFLTNDEEASGILDATSILGAGWFLLDVQAHYGIPGELVEGGQLLSLYDPGSL